MKKIVHALLLLFSSLSLLYSSDKAQLLIQVNDFITGQAIGLRVDKTGTFSELGEAYKKANKFADGVEVKFFIGGNSFDNTQQYTSDDLIKNKVGVLIKRKWDISPIGTLVPTNKHFSIEYRTVDNVDQLKRLIRKKIASDKLANSNFYTVAIKKGNDLLNNAEDIPFTNPFSDYTVTLNKTNLNYSRALKDKQIIIQLTQVPEWTLYLPSTTTTIAIENINIYAKPRSTNTLQINVDTYGNVKNASSVMIDNPAQYQCYQELLHFLNYEAFINSNDFTNAKTLRLYQLSKQLTALWALQNGFILKEDGNQVPIKPSPRAWGEWLQLQKTKFLEMFQSIRNFWKTPQTQKVDISTFAK